MGVGICFEVCYFYIETNINFSVLHLKDKTNLFCIFVKNQFHMNALRQFVTATDSASLLITLPPEYRQQRLEIIVLPLNDSIDSTNDSWGTLMNKMSKKATENGLTPEKLNELLND